MHQKFKEGSPFTNPKVLSLGFTAEHHLSADRSEFIAPLAWIEETFIYTKVIPKENSGCRLSRVAFPELIFFTDLYDL